MSAETELYSALTSWSAVTSIVGSGATTRVYPDVVPQEIALPAISFSRTETEYVQTIHSAQPVAETASFDVYCMAATRTTADALGAAAADAASYAGWTVRSRSAVPADVEQGVLATLVQVSKFRSL